MHCCVQPGPEAAVRHADRLAAGQACMGCALPAKFSGRPPPQQTLTHTHTPCTKRPTCCREVGPRHAWKVKLRVVGWLARVGPPGTATWTCAAAWGGKAGSLSMRAFSAHACGDASCPRPLSLALPARCMTQEAGCRQGDALTLRTAVPACHSPGLQQPFHLAEICLVDKHRLAVAARELLCVWRAHPHRHLRPGWGSAAVNQSAARRAKPSAA